MRQLVSFGIIGALAFFVDAGVLTLLIRFAGVNVYAGRVVSFLVAATFTWWLNRQFTFRGNHSGRVASQWLRFLSVNAVGGLINVGVYALLVAQVATVKMYPVIGVAAGSIAGLLFNFSLSKRLVFHARAPR